LAQFTLLLLPVELVDAELLELLELLQPAASTIIPIAAPAATIVLVARKVCPSHAAPERGPVTKHLG
jgi:hypothetical protein